MNPHVSAAVLPPRPAATQAMPAPPTTVVVKKGHGCLWAALIIIGLGILGVVIFAVAVNKAVDDLNAEQQSHAITKEQFDSIPLGMSRDQVTATLGKEPEDTQEFVNKGFLDESEVVNTSCIYYNDVGESFGSRFQFCFGGDGGLEGKNAY